MMKRFLFGFVAATSAASLVFAQATPPPASVAPTEYIYNTTTNSTSNNTNNNTSTNTNNNNNTSTSTSANTNVNQNINSGTMTNNNNNTTTSTNVNQNINSGTMTNINQNTSASTSDNTNRNINTDTSNSTINQSVNSKSDNTNRNIDTSNSTINSTASNVNQNNNVNVSDSKSYSESVNRQVIDQNIKSPPPSAIAPSMMSYSQDLCTTGQSGAVQTQIIGLSAGRTVRDQNCERMKLSKTLYDMGMRVAAVSLLCQDTRVFKAMEMAGTPCPFMGAIGEAATAAWEENADRRPDAD
jgi:hypothetical protein